MRDIRSLFPTDDPVPAGMMIGRGHDVEDIVRALADGTNIVLAGPRRTGKTSVGEAAMAQLRAAAGQPHSGEPVVVQG
jgi:predicted AAA+ superfamily ATPase